MQNKGIHLIVNNDSVIFVDELCPEGEFNFACHSVAPVQLTLDDM